VPVTLITSTLPTGVGATWTGNPVAGPGSATIKLTVSTGARKGTYPVVVTGTSSGRTRTVTVSLRVT